MHVMFMAETFLLQQHMPKQANPQLNIFWCYTAKHEHPQVTYYTLWYTKE